MYFEALRKSLQKSENSDLQIEIPETSIILMLPLCIDEHKHTNTHLYQKKNYLYKIKDTTVELMAYIRISRYACEKAFNRCIVNGVEQQHE